MRSVIGPRFSPFGHGPEIENRLEGVLRAFTNAREAIKNASVQPVRSGRSVIFEAEIAGGFARLVSEIVDEYKAFDRIGINTPPRRVTTKMARRASRPGNKDAFTGTLSR